jgi:uncharacterized membrane protein YphA (DoxX/SURF4 family)
MSNTQFSSARGARAPKRPPSTRSATRTGADQAFVLLRTVFTVAPIAFGLDKFFGVLTNWEQYLAPWVNDLVPGTAHQAMLAVGVVEILAGILVAVRPSIGAYVIVAWLAGIIVNLVTMGNYYDVALRDFGLLVGALALARLAGPPFSRGISATMAAAGDAR